MFSLIKFKYYLPIPKPAQEKQMTEEKNVFQRQ